MYCLLIVFQNSYYSHKPIKVKGKKMNNEKILQHLNTLTMEKLGIQFNEDVYFLISPRLKNGAEVDYDVYQDKITVKDGNYYIDEDDLILDVINEELIVEGKFKYRLFDPSLINDYEPPGPWD